MKTGLMILCWLLGVTVSASSQEANSIQRPYLPVVLTGGQLPPSYLNLPVQEIKIYRYDMGANQWEAVPFQMDERDRPGASFLGDKNGLLDGPDEVVLMAADLGDRAPIISWPEDAQARSGNRVEIRVHDPLDENSVGWFYVFQSATLPLAAEDYIDFDLTTDRIETATFQIAHGANGFQDEIILKQSAGGDGIDFLDRQKFRLRVLIRELGINKEITLKEEMDENINIIGNVPARVKVERGGVRANENHIIRLHREIELKGSFKFDFLGIKFNIDTSFGFPMTYYPNFMELSTGEIDFKKQDEFDVREFRISADLNSKSRGMIFRSPNNPDGYSIDGVKDEPDRSLIWPGSNWIMSVANPDGPPSQITQATMMTIMNFVGESVGNEAVYYYDWILADSKDTGDKISFGDSGLRVTGNDIHGKMDATLASFYLPLNLTLAEGQTLSDQYNNPLILTPTEQSALPLVLAVDPPEGGQILTDPDGGLYESGTLVTLTAVPNPGFVFSHWTGDLTGSLNPETLNMDAAKSVIAVFVPETKVTISTNLAGPGYEVDGTRYTSRKTFSWLPGETHEICADELAGIYSGVEARFDTWDHTATRCFTYTVPGSADSLTARFSLFNQLELRISPELSGLATGDPQGDAGWYAAGTAVVLEATPFPGFRFGAWTGSLQSQENPVSIVMNGSKRITANFENSAPVVTLPDTGFVENDTLVFPFATLADWITDDITPDSLLIIRFIPNEFISVDIDSGTGEVRIFTTTPSTNGLGTLRISATDQAGYTGADDMLISVWPPSERVFRLALNSSPPHGGSILRDPVSVFYHADTTVMLTAEPASGFYFSHWAGDLSGSINPAALVMDTTKSVAAIFRPLANITVKTSLDSVPFRVDTTRYENTQSFAWMPGDTHSICVDSTVLFGPGSRAQFAQWNQGQALCFEYVVPASDDSLIAGFGMEYLLTTVVVPDSSGSVSNTPPSPDGWYTAETEVQLLASPVDGFHFLQWNGFLNVSDNPVLVRMTEPQMVTAHFGNNPPVLSLPDTTFAEDDTLLWPLPNLWTWIEDDNNADSTLTVRLTGGRFIGVRLDSTSGDYSLFNRVPHWNGSDTIFVTATDPVGQTGSDTVFVTVTPVPDAPFPFEILEPEEGEIFSDWPDVLTFSWAPAFDPDAGDTLVYTLEIDTSKTFDSDMLFQVALNGTHLTFPWPKTHGDATYYWRVRVMDTDSLMTNSSEPYHTLSLATGIDFPGQDQIPDTYVLYQNYPNPFNGETTIRFGLPKDDQVKLIIFNSFGQQVATLVDKEEKAGYHTVHWRGVNDTGQSVASGMYFIRIRASEFHEVKKTIYLR